MIIILATVSKLTNLFLRSRLIEFLMDFSSEILLVIVTPVANDKGDNEMILGLCTDLLAFALQLRKTPENLS